MKSRLPLTYLGQVGLVAVAYHVLGRFGLSISVLKVTPVWPASGVALAAVLFFGARIWPGIFIGAFTLNLWNTFDYTHIFKSVLQTTGSATGSTLAPLLGGFMLVRYASGLRCLDRASTAFRFVALGAMLSTLVSAAIGSTCLLVGGTIPMSAYQSIGFTWWMGDLAGVLTVTPLLLSFHNRRTFVLSGLLLAEAGLLLSVILCIAAFAFREMIPAQYHAEYMLMPCLVWAAFRFRLEGAAMMTVVVACIALWATTHGFGPFVTGSRNESLLSLQVFMDVTAMTTLVLSAVLTERRDKTAEMIRTIREAQEQHILELKEAEAKLRKAEQLELLGRLVSGVAHEVRSPLFAISTAAQVLEKRAPEAQDYVSLILTQVERLKKLMTDLLETGRPTTGWLMSNQNAWDLLRTAKANLEASSPDAAGRIAMPGDPKAVIVHANPDKLVQVFLNILENAVQHSPKTPGAVCIEIAETPVEIVIRARDCGSGISTENINRIFEPFFTTRTSGVGLGLMIAKQIMEAHEGTIRAYNNPSGAGCTFEMVFPRPDQSGETA